MDIETAGLSLVFATAALLQAANAQDDQQNDAAAVEEIVVTGSRLVRRDFNAPSPISTTDSTTMFMRV